MQRTVEATLEELPTIVRRENIQAPALVVVGEVVRLRQELAWFEARPLFGKRIILTRPRRQVGEMASRVEALGGQAVLLPTMEIEPPGDWSPVDRALERLPDYHWLVFSSSNGVHSFIERLQHSGRDLRALGRLQLAVIGPATAEALRSYHLEPDVMPNEYNSEGLAASLRRKSSRSAASCSLVPIEGSSCCARNCRWSPRSIRWRSTLRSIPCWDRTPRRCGCSAGERSTS